MSNRVTEFYTELLKTAGLFTVDDVVHQTLVDGSDAPITVDKKTLVLPTSRWLDDKSFSNLQAFHPLAENVLRKESKIFRFTKKIMLLSLSANILDLMENILHFAVNVETHKTLNPVTQTPVLSLMTDADEKFFENFKKIKTKINPQEDILAVAMLRGKTLNDKEYSRIARVTFPLLEAITEPNDNVIFGIKFRKKDIAIINNLVDYILPEIRNADEYSYGSRSGVAPSFHALLGAWAKIVNTLNHIRHTWGIEEIPLSWEDDLTDFSALKGLIPALPGCDGEPLPNEQQETKREPTEQERTRGRYVEGSRSIVRERQEEQREQRSNPQRAAFRDEEPKPGSFAEMMARAKESGDRHMSRGVRSVGYRSQERGRGYSSRGRGYNSGGYRRSYR